MAEKILDAIKKLKTQEKRNFPQTFDLIVKLTGIDLKKPESKINDEFKLPHGYGVDSKIGIFSDTIKNSDAMIMNSAELERFTKDKRAAKKLVKDIDFFLAESKLMPLVGKSLGQFLAPRGRMPKLLSSDVNSTIDNLKKSIRIRVKDSPVIQCKIGKETMDDEKVIENAKAVFKHLETRLPKGRANIGKLYLKLTMSEPIEIEV
ncbi:MAG: 50S ribosomal protein L1 [Candidatus Aenigmarchaeota archaeon]|nr:50S ribosomal protein L1 [Candidatus Aenigmarchaeota archaeon]